MYYIHLYTCTRTSIQVKAERFGHLCTSAIFDFLAEVVLVEQALPPHLQELDLTGEELRHGHKKTKRGCEVHDVMIKYVKLGRRWEKIFHSGNEIGNEGVRALARVAQVSVCHRILGNLDK